MCKQEKIKAFFRGLWLRLKNLTHRLLCCFIPKVPVKTVPEPQDNISPSTDPDDCNKTVAEPEEDQSVKIDQEIDTQENTDELLDDMYDMVINDHVE